MRGDELEELLRTLDLEFWFDREGLAHRFNQGSSGRQINVKECPECGDRRWRVYMNAQTGLGNCFVCNKGFNKLSFIRAALELSTAQTIHHIREVCSEQGWRARRTQSVAVDDGAVVLPLSVPLPTPEGSNLLYLEARGVDAGLARYFHLRFCENGWWRYRRDDGSTGVQDFSQRLIIPVYDLDGSLVTFQGRALRENQEPRYLFPAALPGTGRFLYNGLNAYRARRVVLNEGAFDVFAAKRAFDEVVELRDVVPVGSFGKHLSVGSQDGNDQFTRLVKLRDAGLEELTIMWDGEPKAFEAAVAAGLGLLGIGISVRIATLPAGKDPNEVPGEVVRQAFQSAQLLTRRQATLWKLRNPYG